MNKTTVIYHSADFDGLFCREIAKHFLPDAELIGWDYGQPEPVVPAEHKLYILDLSVPTLMQHQNLTWIDHHKSAIDKYDSPALSSPPIPGYRIDGVAACRLAWQWFTNLIQLPTKQDFIDRKVTEPLAVRLAGEYDIWDKRDPCAEVFQFGLRSQELSENAWDILLSGPTPDKDGQRGLAEIAVDALLEDGEKLQFYQRQRDAGAMRSAYILEWQGLKFLALNTARGFNSLTFASRDVPETGHDALLGYGFDGKWRVSLYHANHRKDIDLSAIAIKFGGGGHRGACGFEAGALPWM